MAAGTRNEALRASIESAVRDLPATLKICECLDDLRLASAEERGTTAFVILEASFPDLLAAARIAHSDEPGRELVILASAAERSDVLARFGPAPRIGSDWHFASSEVASLSKTLRTAYQRAEQRRATRTTLDRFNARLSAPSQVDTRELRQLVISDSFLSSILESSLDAVILVDTVGNIASFNPSAERLFQKARAKVLSLPVHELSKGNWATDVQNSVRLSNSAGLVQSEICIDDELKHVEFSVTPVRDQAGNTVAVSLIVRDVTMRMLSEEALRTNEKLAAVGRLASSIAHEINNPLEAVTNLIYLARLNSNEREVQEYLDSADGELRRMANITNQTLRFHKQASIPRLVTAEDLMEGALSLFHTRAVSRGVEILNRFRASRPVLCLDGEIRQVLNNLIGNAIDVMSNGGQLHLRSRETAEGRERTAGIVMTVGDSGSGMSVRTIEKIFDPFFTTKGAGGTGLGLWISKGIVERHRGELRVRSSQREGCCGTVFSLFLPFDPRFSVPLRQAGPGL